MTLEQKMREALLEGGPFRREFEESNFEDPLEFLRSASKYPRVYGAGPRAGKVKLEHYLQKDNVLYYNESGELFSDKTGAGISDVSPIKYFAGGNKSAEEPEDSPSGQSPTPCKIFLVSQDSRGPFHKTEHGYLKINLHAFSKSFAKWTTMNTLIAFYVVDENKLYFKSASSIFNYAQSIIDRKTIGQKDTGRTGGRTAPTNFGANMLDKEVFLKLKPESDKKNRTDYEPFDEETKRRISLDRGNTIDPRDGKYSMGLPAGRLIYTKLPTVMDEGEFITYLNTINNYSRDFRLNFKTATRILGRL